MTCHEEHQVLEIFTLALLVRTQVCLTSELQIEQVIKPSMKAHLINIGPDLLIVCCGAYWPFGMFLNHSM